MKKLCNIKLVFIILLFISKITTQAFSQTSSCWCNGSANICVSTAQELYNALYVPVPQSGQIIEICGTIYLGDLPFTVNDFPLRVPAGVILQGNYNYISGTRLVFPYRYKSAIKCDKQLRSANGEIIQQALPANEDDAVNQLISGTDAVFVFAMEQGSQFNNICLQGPKPDFKEQYMYSRLEPLISNPLCHPNMLAFNEREGLCGGLLMRGNGCSVTGSEIYGFPTYNIHIRPEFRSATNPLGTGTATIRNSFLHSSKWLGFGYGLFGSGGGGSNCNNTEPCITGIAALNAYNDGNTQNINITNTILMDNGKDIDAAGHGYNLTVTGSSLGLRTQGNIVNQHFANGFNLLTQQVENSQLCNIAPQTAANTCTNPNFLDCCNSIISHLSGEHISFTGNNLFSGAGEFELGYPNTYTPFNNCSLGTTRPSGIDILYNNFLGENTNHDNRIFICRVDHLLWRPEHFFGFSPRGPLNTLNVMPTSPVTVNQQNNYHLFTDNIPGIPTSVIGAKLPPLAYQTPTSVNSILVGNEIYFNTEQCLTAGQQPSDFGNMWYMWRFHEQPDDITDEWRSDHYQAANPLIHRFNQIGITNVNLVGVDRATNRVSYIATHPVTVRPADHNLHLVFWIKDTYEGAFMDYTRSCIYDVTPMVLPPNAAPIVGSPACTSGVACNGDPFTTTLTGFVKFVRVNGVILWSQDIGMDGGGWQRIEYPRPHSADLPLDTYLCTDDGKAANLPNGCASIIMDRIEIGIMAINDVNALEVRGVNLFIDDVYLNNGRSFSFNYTDDNASVIVNGDFEAYDPANHYPLGWNAPVNNVPLFYNSICYPLGITTGNSTLDSKLQSFEVRSGIYSYWGRIKAALAPGTNLIPLGTAYPSISINGVTQPYISISQDFDMSQNIARMAKRTVNVLPIDFTIKPNPSAFGTTLNGSIQNLPPNQAYQISIYSPDGTLQYLGNGNTSEFTISKSLTAGVYYVKVWGNGFSNYKRIVVVG